MPPALTYCPSCGARSDQSHYRAYACTPSFESALSTVAAQGWMLSNLVNQTLTGGQPSFFAVLTVTDDRFTIRAGAGPSPAEAILTALAASSRRFWGGPTDEGTSLAADRPALSTVLKLRAPEAPIRRV